MKSLKRNERHAKNYNVTIPYLSYEPIKPRMTFQTTKIGPRNVWKLQKGWVDVFLYHFFEQYRFPCSFSVKYHHVVPEPIHSDYISFKGRCSDQNCRASFFGGVKNEPKSGENVTVNFLAINTTGIEHTNKRFLKQPKRSLICEDIINSGASQWRRKTVDKLIDYGEVEPPILYKSSVLRKAKQQYIDNTLSIGGHDPINSIVSLKHEVEHSGTIHSIGSDPFFCHYWLPTQEHIYKSKRSKTWTTISVDATGSLVLPIMRTKSKITSAHIFLYQMVAEIEDQTVPIAQQLSEKQDMLSIYYWMASWVNTVIIPNECVCDYSKALLGAITRAFCNRKSLKEYNSMCFDFLTGEKSLLPECYVRVDVAHIIHMLCRWKCLSARKPIKDFYVRCISLLIKSQNINMFKSALEMIIIVACANTDGVDNNLKNTPAEDARKNLIESISRGNIDISINENTSDDYKGISIEDTFFIDEENPKDLYEDNQQTKSTINTWLDEIKFSSIEKSNVVGDRISALYCPDLIKPLMRICSEFPLWSAVMVQHFGSPKPRPSSSRVEGYFSTLKTSIISKKTARMRVDKFLVTHLRAIRGDIKLAAVNENINEKEIKKMKLDNSIKDSSIQVNFPSSKVEVISNNHDKIDCESSGSGNSDSEVDCRSSISNNHEEQEFENWRNKASPPSPIIKKTTAKRTVYLDAHPEIKLKQKINKKISKKRIDLIRNGNCMRPLRLQKDKKKYQIINTCAFDSVIQAMASAYLDSEEYSNSIDTNALCKTSKLASHLVKEGANRKFYEERIIVLRDYCKRNQLIGELTELDAQVNVAILIDKLFIDDPSIFQYHTCDNFKCGQSVANIPLFPIDQGTLVTGLYNMLLILI